MKLFILTVLFNLVITIASAQEVNSPKGEYTATSTIVELLGETSAKTFQGKISINKPIEWEIYVPQFYNPAKPAGVLVFINSRNSGKILEEWKILMEQNNLIWIGANESGNDMSISQRVAYAIVAPTLINNSYSIDPERVYISGFSGGGRIASLVATEYTNLFKGAIFNSGANYWGEVSPSRIKEMENYHYVFIAGTEDFNLEDTKEVYNAYKKAGVINSKLMIIPDMAHERPAAANLDIAIKYLDSGITGITQ